MNQTSMSKFMTPGPGAYDIMSSLQAFEDDLKESLSGGIISKSRRSNECIEDRSSKMLLDEEIDGKDSALNTIR